MNMRLLSPPARSQVPRGPWPGRQPRGLDQPVIGIDQNPPADTAQTVRGFASGSLADSFAAPQESQSRLGVATALYRGNRSSRGDSPGTTGVRAVLSTIPISE